MRRNQRPIIETYLDDLAFCGGDTMIGVLGLEDGTRLEGYGFGVPSVVSGELVFTINSEESPRSLVVG
ncbi:MAG: hypothetical protein MUO26_07970 [Methanotrichaceae archaeon]|nr:hypothetical protein [Methanotrichaceae archaeon]